MSWMHEACLQNVCCSPSLIRMMKSRRIWWADHVARMRNGTYTNGLRELDYWLLMGKPDGKRLRGRERGRCMANIKMDLGELGWDCLKCISLAQDRHKLRYLGFHKLHGKLSSS
jgi:hypothetical protein